jgi:hypothetical protein
MEAKVFETNIILENYLLTSGFTDVTKKVNPDKPDRKRFKRKDISVEFEYINVTIIKGNGIVFSEPEISKSKLEMLLK